MIIKHLELINFRNYEKLSLNFDKGINFIVGENAKGKTNLVESIYSLSLAKSFRTSNSNELLMINKNFAEVKGIFINENCKKIIEIAFLKDGKKIKINNTLVKKTSELNSIVSALYFIPKDTNLLKDVPKNRRQFLNSNISKMNENYLKNIIQYEKLLKERNDALKALRLNFTLIEIITNKLIELSYEIFKERVEFIKKLNPLLNEVYKNISLSETQKISIRYIPFIKELNKAEYEAHAKELYKNSLEEDIKKKSTSLGIQKEDFKIYLDEKDVGVFGSQGENRMITLSLKIAPYYLISEAKDKPIIILDDILSELDEKHEENLIHYLENFEQVFITNTRKSDYFTKKYYLVNENKVSIEEVN